MTPKFPLHWPNVLFLTVTPLLAFALGSWYIPHYGISHLEIALFVALFFATGLSITGGYHRHFAHVSYKANPLVRFFYLVFGACAMQNSALNWASDHRLHHRYTDTDKDPYNAGQGFFWSHLGWIFYQSRAEKQLTNVGDLLKDRWVRWQHRNHVSIALVVGFGIPLAIGFAVGRPLGGLLWGGLIRVVFVHHATFFINSLAHMYGSQEYSRTDTSRDSWWLAVLTNGEGYHNFHHRFPSDYRNGIQWFHWDPTKWLIYGLNLVGGAERLHRIPAHLILRARMEVEAQLAEKRLEIMPVDVGLSWRARVSVAQERFEQAISQWADTKAQVWEMKKAEWQDSERLADWRKKLSDYESRLEEAKMQWRMCLRGLQRA